MTVSTVMQLQDEQPGRRRFAVLVADPHREENLAVIPRQILAGDVGLQLGVAHGDQQFGGGALEFTVLKKELHDLVHEIGNPLPAQVVGIKLLGDLPADAAHLHFQLLFLHVAPGDAEGCSVAEALLLAENHHGVRHAHDAGGAGHIVEDIAAVPTLPGVVHQEDADAVIVGDLFQRRQIPVILGVGVDLPGDVVPDHLQRVDEDQPGGGVILQHGLDLAFQLRAQLTAGEAEMQVLRRHFGQLLHPLLNAPLPVLQRQVDHVGFPGGDAPYRLALADLQAEPEDHPALADLGVAGHDRQPVGEDTVNQHPRVRQRLVVQRLRIDQLNLVHVFHLLSF